MHIDELKGYLSEIGASSATISVAANGLCYVTMCAVGKKMHVSDGIMVDAHHKIMGVAFQLCGERLASEATKKHGTAVVTPVQNDEDLDDLLG